MKRILLLSAGIVMAAVCAAFAEAMVELDHFVLFDPPI